MATSIAVAGSQAATIAALQDGTSIAWIDTDQKKVIKTVPLSGERLWWGWTCAPPTASSTESRPTA